MKKLEDLNRYEFETLRKLGFLWELYPDAPDIFIEVKNKMLTFEQYLSEKFWRQYNGLDDDSVEAEQEWLAELEPQDFIDYGQSWVKEYYNRLIRE